MSPEGVHDLIGNAWEWIENEYNPFKGSTYQSEYFDSGYKVLRGHSARDIGHFPGPLYLSALKQFARSGHRSSPIRTNRPPTWDSAA